MRTRSREVVDVLDVLDAEATRRGHTDASPEGPEGPEGLDDPGLEAVATGGAGTRFLMFHC